MKKYIDKGMTVLSTDFNLMVKKIAEFALGSKADFYCVPTKLILRNFYKMKIIFLDTKNIYNFTTEQNSTERYEITKFNMYLFRVDIGSSSVKASLLDAE